MPDRNFQSLEIPFDLEMLFYLKACFDMDKSPNQIIHEAVETISAPTKEVNTP